ncbi:MAG: hypothetical protein IJS08_07505 [Victivallales bacterium]|nr:hypothetical protein [Victivallales bacterium]
MDVFELKAVVLGEKCRDGSYDVYKRQLGIFSSRRKAEKFMPIIIEKEKKYTRFFAFFIYRRVLDEGLHGPFDIISEFHEVWSYQGDGSFYCHGACDDTCERHFFGRDASTIMLKKGELAWYMAYDKIIPCIVSILPMTDVEYRRRVRELGHDMGLDYSDDSYLVYKCCKGEPDLMVSHEHPVTWELFPFFGSLSKRNREYLQAIMKKSEED